MKVAVYRVLVCGLLLALLLSDVPVSAAQTNPITLAAQAGLDGYFKDGAWVPVRIAVANDGPDVQATLKVAVPRNYGSAETVYARDVDLPTQSQREIFIYVAAEGMIGNLTVSLADRDRPGRTLASSTARLVLASPTDLIFGVLAGSPSAFSYLSDLDPQPGLAFTAQIMLADLPPLGQGWQALDVLVISDVDTGQLSPEQRAALRAWVSGGGRLIVAGGPAWQKTTAGLADLLPVIPSGTRTISDWSSLAVLAAAGAPDGSAVAAVGQAAPDAQVLAQAEDGAPLIAFRGLGFGSVTYLAVDPAFAPLRGWAGMEGLFRSLLARSIDRPSWTRGFHNWSQADDAIGALPELALPSAFQICGFLSVYLIVIGPLNYLVLKRLRRRELAWLSIPAIVLVFSLAAYLSGYQMRGGQATLHQLAIVQVWTDSDLAQVDQLVGVFSPRRVDYDVEFPAGFLVRPIPYGNAPDDLAFQQSDRTTVSGLRTDVGTVTGFAMRGSIPAPRFESDLRIIVQQGIVTLDGTVSNLSDLVLKDAVLLAPGGAASVLRLGDLLPGETRQVSLGLSSSRATPSLAPVILPPAVNTPLLAPGYAPPSGYDSTLDDILGNTNYYNDRLQFRRYSLLSASIDTWGGAGRGSGVYLAGWTSAAPVSAGVIEQESESVDETLYLVTLRPAYDLGGSTLTIPAGLMTWSVVDAGQSSSPGPYDVYLYPGYAAYSLRFAPAWPVLYREVKELTLHLTSYGARGPTGLSVALWDFEAGAYASLGPLDWGDAPVTSPQRYVGPTGEIQVRVDLATNLQVNIEALDFTLTVER